ncbi:hypothetical protein [Lactiplantibacillus plantarum]|uniref:hypothetical protein n=1 Tax=Lactiplantibacillus plantarum TaxID=1590 RepID=UPI0007BBEFE0|nr:hypothetical protein [Lactiplantibacillus plantarum]KZU59352.1 hypothetical protein Nizo2776_0215 [Lactiplantibacillus plantarum]
MALWQASISTCGNVYCNGSQAPVASVVIAGPLTTTTTVLVGRAAKKFCTLLMAVAT